MSGTWKHKYVLWYRIIESVFGNEVPHLSEDEIEACVSNIDWMIIPIPGERSKQDARLAQRPNLYFLLENEDQIIIGVTYDKINSVTRLSEIVSPFNEKFRNAILEEMGTLDDAFQTKVFRKTKTNYWAESPQYEEVLVEQSNQMNLTKFSKMFKTVDKIMAEREMLEKGKKYQLAPAINLVETTTARNEKSFKKALSQIKPIYEIAVNVKTTQEFEEEESQREADAIKKNQENFARYIAELKEKLSKNMITPEQYREMMMKYKEV